MTVNYVGIGRIECRNLKSPTRKAELKDNIAVRNGRIGGLF